MQYDILNNGPIVGYMYIMSDFYTYASGTYVPTTGSYSGMIALRIYGWDFTGAIWYWKARGSFGTAWGSTGDINV